MENSRNTWPVLGLALLLSACGGGDSDDDGGDGGNGGNGNPDNGSELKISGTWVTREVSDETDCDAGTIEYLYPTIVTRMGSDVAVAYDYEGGDSYTGSISGDSATWSGSYELDGGDNAFSVTMNFDGRLSTGTATWSWVSNAASCSGTSQITAYCAEGDCLLAEELASAENFAGQWQVVEDSDETDCDAGVVTYEYPVTISQDGNLVTVMDGDYTFSGVVDGDTASWAGIYGDEGAVVFAMDLTRSAGSGTGSVVWTWSDMSAACSGTSVITATCVSGGCLE